MSVSAYLQLVTSWISHELDVRALPAFAKGQSETEPIAAIAQRGTSRHIPGMRLSRLLLLSALASCARLQGIGATRQSNAPLAVQPTRPIPYPVFETHAFAN